MTPTRCDLDVDRLRAGVRGCAVSVVFRRPFVGGDLSRRSSVCGMIELLERKDRSAQAIGRGKTELVEMKSLLDADLGDNTLRNRLSQAIGRVLTRIDLSDR